MKLKPIYEAVSCAPLGYDDVTIHVLINPSNDLVHEYWDAHKAMIDTLAMDHPKLDDVEAVYEEAMVKLIDSVRQQTDDGEDVYRIDTRDDLNRFGDEQDIHIIRYGLSVLWEMRNDRVSNAVDRFRDGSGQLPIPQDGAAAG